MNTVRSFEENIKSIEKSLRYVCNVKEPDEVCNDQLAYEAVWWIIFIFQFSRLKWLKFFK